MKKMIKTPLAAVMGTAVVSTFAATVAHAEANPFGMTELSSGYMQVAEAKEATCGEGKCGASMNMGATKMPEGKCAGQETKPKKQKAKEAACGEGKCGAMMENGKMKKGMEGACGEMMKGKEGACGNMMKNMKGKEGSCGDMMKGMKGKEGSCGDKMKGKDGSCGAMMKDKKDSGADKAGKNKTADQ